MAVARRLISRLPLQTHNIQAQRRLYSKKPASRNPVPEVNARGFDTTFDIVKVHRKRRDARPMSFSEFMRAEVRKALRKRRAGEPMSFMERMLVEDLDAKRDVALRTMRNGVPMSLSELCRADVRRTLRKRRDGGPLSFSERMLVMPFHDKARARRHGGPPSLLEFLRKGVKSPVWWTQFFIIFTVLSMLPPWEDSPENREWVDEYCPWASWCLVKTKRQREEEESAGEDHQGCGSKEDAMIEEWNKLQKRNEERVEELIRSSSTVYRNQRQ